MTKPILEQDTESSRVYADGPFLTARAMAWFWDCYLPDRGKRAASAAVEQAMRVLRAALGTA